jgi:tetratricopeptide (TPR) repeat protein
LERLLKLVREDGFILINDYGQTQVTPGDEYEHQRFSHSVSMGLNFPLLKAYFGESGRCEWLEPLVDDTHIYPRLLGHKVGYETRLRFGERFGLPVREWEREPENQARELIKTGHFETAASSYAKALERQPNNWMLMNEISLFLTFSLRDFKAGMDLAKVALTLNPVCSSELWSTLGDGLFEFGRIAEARSAYWKALEVNAADVRARYNLAWVYTREKDYESSLAMLAEALAVDQRDAYRERILQKQQEILGHLALRNHQEYLRLANRISIGVSKPGEADTPSNRDGKDGAKRETQTPR